jgi:hypothetical protein
MKYQTRTIGGELIVVLGAGVDKDGVPSKRTVARTLAALQLAKQLPEATVIVTGNGRSNKWTPRSLTEAAAMTRILEKNGIERSRIRQEYQAVDTIGNAILVAARYLMDTTPRKIHLVTSPFHAERASVMFHGIYGTAWPIEVCASEACDGDDVKGAQEHGGIEWANRFLEATTPGDFDSAIRRLLEIGKPIYRQLGLRALLSDRSRARRAS